MLSADGRALPERVTCLIAGGGPAGMMLGVLLARAGVEVCVLEKHADFLRDFRGDTVHPSTLEVLHEMGVLDAFLERPHQEVRVLRGRVGTRELTLADFSHLPTRCRFIAFMPQWDFLDFLAAEGRRHPGFHLAMETEVVDLVQSGDRVVGFRALQRGREVELFADLSIGADGRGSVVRARAGLPRRELGAPIDVLWLRLPKADGDPSVPLGRVVPGRVFITLDRGDYWQCAFVIAKGGLDTMKARGLPAFRDEIVRAAPELRDRVGALDDWDDVKLLTVKVDRLERWWRDGLLCIGDAAHAMSPIGGVGINLAIQDAVAAANRLAIPLGSGSVTAGDLDAVQRRRAWPTRVTQAVQVLLQDQVIRRVLDQDRDQPLHVPLPLRALDRWPRLRRLPARLIGLGARPEHLRQKG
ncbi:MAG: FAD-dependent oxidoreductase [Vicinamibacterales bacterium]